MHMVHYNTRYKTFANAVDKHDGLAVLGVFLQVSLKIMFYSIVQCQRHLYQQHNSIVSEQQITSTMYT
jgi:hydroxyacyl-ACP dehydratase HTD2-like protein with hotdog domain